jgi:peptidoglycan/LPS O-acetylase OafA/YrhL
VFKYREDITGLRGLAVLLVLLFHYFPESFPSGYLGVDIFFVISGFVISKILLTEISMMGEINLKNFFSKRIKRLLPSLVIILLASNLFAFFYYLPDEMYSHAKQIIASAFYVQNFLMLSEVGYFNLEAKLKPLLHLWSLSVEAQFYIAMPLIFMVLAKKIKLLIYTLIIIFFLSLFVVIATYDSYSDILFYVPFTRAWEFLAGSFVAFIQSKMDSTKPLQKNNKTFLANAGYIFSFTSIGLIALIQTKSVEFPITAVFFVVLFTTYMLSIPNGFVQQWVLRSKLFIFLGRISYALYLWHWLLFSNYVIIKGDGLSFQTSLALIFLSILLGTITTIFFEEPIRRNKAINGKYAIFALLLLTTPNLFFLVTHQPKVSIINHLDQNYWPCKSKFLLTGVLKEDGVERCFQSLEKESIDILLVGDSHAEAAFIAFADAFPNQNVAYYTRSMGPFLSNMFFSNLWNPLRENKEIKHIVFTSFWISNSEINISDEMSRLIKYFEKSNKQIYLMQDVPSFEKFPNVCLRWGDCSDPTPRSIYNSSNSYFIEFEALSVKFKNVFAIKIEDIFCNEFTCNLDINGEVLFSDRNHLNVDGSKYLGLNFLNKKNSTKEGMYEWISNISSY